ncbi:MAG: ROK family transcriptional regulator [Clostridiales bacterium]|nr:ROK family transcriptional regulator [Clostridiales bacterium]
MALIGKPQTLKEVNSSTIERLLFKHGTLTQPKLAELAELSLPTVNRIISDLEDTGTVCAAGHTTEGAGRKAVLYQINSDAGCIVVLYYSWGKYLCRLTDIVGNTLYETVCELDNSTSRAAIDSTVLAVETVLGHARSDVKVIGIGIPGALMPDGKIFAIPKIEVWEGVDLEKELSVYFDAPIYIENDVKLTAVGYYNAYLRKKKVDNFVYIYAGNGMGSGIIINKKLYRGSSNFSGELGFMAPLDGEAPQFDYTMEGGYLENKMTPFINDYKRGSENANHSSTSALVNFFTSIAANYTAIINPAAIVFGGEAFNEALSDEIRKRLALFSPERSISHIIYDDSEDSGINGLVLACVGEMINDVRIIQTGGV